MIKFRAVIKDAAGQAQRLVRFSGAKIIGEVFRTDRERILKRLRRYPPERPRQRYRRTNRLADEYAVQISVWPGGAKAEVTNPTPYRKWVRGPEQAWMHQGRWEKETDILESERPALEHNIISRAIKALTNG